MPIFGGAGGSGKGLVPRYKEILVERIATIISAMKYNATNLVNKPPMISKPPIISAVAIKLAMVSGIGKPSLVNLPAPWLVYTNFKTPSQKKTPPAINLSNRIEEGPSVGDCENHSINFFISIIC